MANDKKIRPTPSPVQLANDLKVLKQSFDQLKVTVGKLKDILQVQDNWHSRVSRWVGTEVEMVVDINGHEPMKCKLLWTDRYNIGVEIDGREKLYNKGHVVCIGPA